MNSKDKSLYANQSLFPRYGQCYRERTYYLLPCQATGPCNTPSKVQPTKIPEKMWNTVNIDYLGPLPNRKYVLVMINQRSRYPVKAVTSSTSAMSLTKLLTQVFLK